MSVAGVMTDALPGLRLKLPATSANLGPGFDTLALALALYLEIEAKSAEAFSIQARGRDAGVCSRLEGNLLLSVYRETVQRYAAREAIPLALHMRNGIPLGMGCGSSAASRLAAVALASYFGGLSWDRERILAEACRLEGHPDNAAACWLGGFVASGWDEQPEAKSGAESGVKSGAKSGAESGAKPGAMPGDNDGREHGQRRSVATSESWARIAAVSIAPPPSWCGLLVLPAAPLATSASRAVLPNEYSRRDAVLNLQRVAVLTAAFAAGRGDLLAAATCDSMHQPYRGPVCPLLPLLQPLAGRGGILSVTLSGAGPSVLLLLKDAESIAQAQALVREQVKREPQAEGFEMITCSLAAERAELQFADSAISRQSK